MMRECKLWRIEREQGPAVAEGPSDEGACCAAHAALCMLVQLHLPRPFDLEHTCPAHSDGAGKNSIASHLLCLIRGEVFRATLLNIARPSGRSARTHTCLAGE